MSEPVPMGDAMNESQEPTFKYQYQNLVDNSPPIEITRQIKDIELWKEVARQLEMLVKLDQTTSQTLRVTTPQKIPAKQHPLPSYEPSEPRKIAAQLVSWLTYIGVDALIADTWRGELKRTRQWDSENRSPSGEKFDDETFKALAVEGYDPRTMAEYKVLFDWYTSTLMHHRVDPRSVCRKGTTAPIWPNIYVENDKGKLVAVSDDEVDYTTGTPLTPDNLGKYFDYMNYLKAKIEERKKGE